MHRRSFVASVAAGAAASATQNDHFGSAVSALVSDRGRQQASLRVNGARVNGHLTGLSEFGKNSFGGVTRLAYTDPDKAGRAYTMDRMREAGLDVSIDAGGNILGRRAGRDASLKPIWFGSHIDSVPEGGNYDGDLGSLGAIEVARTLREENIVTKHPLVVVVWQNEEGGLWGSRAATAELSDAELAKVSRGGRSIRDGIAFIGGDPANLARTRLKKGDVTCYFELHIEQGGTLEKEKLDVGIVEGIVGISEWNVTIEGFANHAGTTAMADRRDAMLSAAQFVVAVHRVVRATPGRQVGNVGKLVTYPGAVNVVPGKVELTLELRDLDSAKIARMYGEIAAEAKKIAASTGTTYAYEPIIANVPAFMDQRMKGFVASAAKTVGLSSKLMPSGAGHDAQSMAQICPSAMIFIPSIGGISHSPKEYSTPKDCVNGVNVLLHALLAADAAM